MESSDHIILLMGRHLPLYNTCIYRYMYLQFVMLASKQKILTGSVHMYFNIHQGYKYKNELVEI